MSLWSSVVTFKNKLWRTEMTYEITEITEEIILDLCECLLRLFTILELSDAGYSSSKFKTFLFGENIKLVDKNVSIDTIKNNFNQHISNNWMNNIHHPKKIR